MKKVLNIVLLLILANCQYNNRNYVGKAEKKDLDKKEISQTTIKSIDEEKGYNINDQLKEQDNEKEDHYINDQIKELGNNKNGLLSQKNQFILYNKSLYMVAGAVLFGGLNWLKNYILTPKIVPIVEYGSGIQDLNYCVSIDGIDQDGTKLNHKICKPGYQYQKNFFDIDKEFKKAVQKKETDYAIDLLKLGVKPTKWHLEEAFDTDNFELFAYLYENYDGIASCGFNYLRRSVYKDNIKMAEFLFKKKCNSLESFHNFNTLPHDIQSIGMLKLLIKNDIDLRKYTYIPSLFGAPFYTFLELMLVPFTLPSYIGDKFHATIYHGDMGKLYKDYHNLKDHEQYSSSKIYQQERKKFYSIYFPEDSSSEINLEDDNGKMKLEDIHVDTKLGGGFVVAGRGKNGKHVVISFNNNFELVERESYVRRF